MQEYKTKLEKANAIISKATAMKHDYMKLKEDMVVKENEVAIVVVCVLFIDWIITKTIRRK